MYCVTLTYCMPVLGLVCLQGLVSSIKLFGSRTKEFISKVVATLQPCLPSIITLRACARGKAIPSVHRLSVCLSAKKFFKYPTSRYFFNLQSCHKLCNQSYRNVRVPHNTEHIAILCTFRSFLLSGAAGRPS